MMQDVFNLFEAMGYEYHRQGSLSDEGEFPASFFTFWNIDSPEMSFYDNRAKRYVELIQVCFYTSDAKLIYSVMDEFVERAKNAGFVPQSMPKDTPSGRASHSGRLVVLQKINNIGG